MPSEKSEEKGIPGKNLIYLAVSLVIIGLMATNIVLNLIWQRPFINDLRERLINYQISEAKRAAETIERFIERELKDIENLSANIAQTGKDSRDAEFFISQFLKQNPAIKEFSIVNLSGQEEKRYSKKEFFSEKRMRDFAFLEEFETAKKGKRYLSRVNFTEYAEPYVIIAMPVRKFEIEKPQAVLRVVFHLREAWSEVLETKIGKSGRISVIDDKGMLIADPNPSRVLKKTNLLDIAPAKPVLQGEIFPGARYLNEKGAKVIGVGVPIKNLRWGVIVEQDVAELEAPLKEITKLTIIFFLAGVIITAILIWLLLILRKTDKTLLERYLALESSRKEIEEAKQLLEIKVKARTKELEELAQSLEEKVKERTKELQSKIDEMERFQKLTIGREITMIEMKKEIKKLKEELEKYKPPHHNEHK
jgi:methyl-accepting chemotaxis protein